MAIDIQGRRFEAVGRCIYCGSDGHEMGLREEHIMPFNLGGNAVLPDASCAKCEGITSYLDGYLGRSIFYDYRLFADVQSRTPRKDRPKTRMVTIRRDGREEPQTYPVEDHPFSLVLPLLEKPGFLGAPVNKAGFVAGRALVFHRLTPDLLEEAEEFPERGLAMVSRGTLNFDAFARALAKIGYCHAVANRDVDPDPSLPLVQYIVGQRPDLGPYLVGYDKRDQEGPRSAIMVKHQIRRYWENFPHKRVLVIAIRLFANTGTEDEGMPTYVVAIKEEPPVAT